MRLPLCDHDYSINIIVTPPCLLLPSHQNLISFQVKTQTPTDTFSYFYFSFPNSRKSLPCRNIIVNSVRTLRKITVGVLFVCFAQFFRAASLHSTSRRLFCFLKSYKIYPQNLDVPSKTWKRSLLIIRMNELCHFDAFSHLSTFIFFQYPVCQIFQKLHSRFPTNFPWMSWGWSKRTRSLINRDTAPYQSENPDGLISLHLRESVILELLLYSQIPN